MKRSISLAETLLGFGEVKACFEQQLLKYEIYEIVSVSVPQAYKTIVVP